MVNKFPYCTSYNEVLGIVSRCAQANPTLRIGQAVACTYKLPRVLEDLIWEIRGNDRAVKHGVARIIFEHTIREDYQNKG